MTCDTSCCVQRAAAQENAAVEPALSCWALVLDPKGGRDSDTGGGGGSRVGLWVWDAAGTRRHFVLTSLNQSSTTKKKDHHHHHHHSQSFTHDEDSSLQELCFASHTNRHNDYMNVDGMLTPCFEEGGRHGVPEETCFCGEEEPHLHAHWRNPKTCNGNNNNKNHNLLQELPNNLLMLKENTTTTTTTTTPVKESDDFSVVATHQGWPCDNARHFMRPKANILRWEANACDSCPPNKTLSSTTTITTTTTTPSDELPTPPQFRLLDKRVWRDETTHQPVKLHIFSQGQEEKQQECPCDFFDCPCSSLDDNDNFSTASTGCCPSSPSPSDKYVTTTTIPSCCGSNNATEQNCQDPSRSPETKACTTPTTIAASSSCGKNKTTKCCSSNLSEKSQEECASSSSSSSSCCEEKTKVESSGETTSCSGTCNKNSTTAAPSCCIKNEPCVAEEKQSSGCINTGCCTSGGKPNSCAEKKLGFKQGNGCEAGFCADGESSSCCARQDQGDGSGKYSTSEVQETSETSLVTPCGRSEFFVKYICCASEIPVIHSILDRTLGIQKVAVNAITKTVYVHHEPSRISANEVVTLLNNSGMGAELRVDAADALKGHQKSLFVVSKFQLVVVGNSARWDRLDIVLKAFDETKIESFAFDERSGVVTVIHNPATMNTQDVFAAVSGEVDKVDILLDGSDQNQSPLDFALLAASAALSDSHLKDGVESTMASSKWPKPNVIISGVLWIVSMLHYINDNWEPLKYVALGSIVFGLPPIGRKAIGTLRQQFKFDANGLMFMASLGAIGLGEYPEAAAVVFLFALSEWLEARASSRAHQALSAIVNLRPTTARLIDPETQQLWSVPAAVVPVGALVAVKAGDQFPCDGVVVEGETTVDESSLTGEARPVRKVPKDGVAGGTINSGVCQLVVRVTAAAEDSTVSRLIRLVEEAQLNRSETEKAIDDFAKIYTPAVLFAAILMFSIPWAYGIETGKKWAYNGLVLIVLACPCALIISTPVVYVAGLAATAQKGILVKGGVFLETLGQLSHICFDKTGTLTNGEFCLLHLDLVGDLMVRQQVLEYLLLMEERASHPVAQAIVDAARNENVTIPQGMTLEKHEILEGEGVAGVINGQDVHIGNERLFERLGLLSDLSETESERVVSWKRLGGTIGFISVSGWGIVGAFCAADAVRPEAASVVANLKKRRIALTMLTGDSEDAAQSVGAQLDWSDGGDRCEIRAKLLPADKLAFVEELTSSYEGERDCFGRKKIVLFCGDGVNDAPALAAAHVGVAMGSGATVAMETAHVTLLDPSLRKLEFVCAMGRQVRAKIAENVTFSIVVKVAFIVWAMTGSPSLWLAIGSDVGSMLLVTLNAMRLLPSQATPGSSIAKQSLRQGEQP